MNTWKHSIIGIIAVIALAFTACDDGNGNNTPAHVHDYTVWKENQPADGRETLVCSHDNSHASTQTRTVMVSVPGGTFDMGQGVGNSSPPVHDVTLTGFYIGKYEVTQAQWQAVMGTTIQELQTAAAPTNTDNFGRGGSYPVYYVRWYDALVFCNKLSVTEGLTPAYRISDSTNPDDWGTVPTSNTAANKASWDAVTIVSDSTGYRLPTEAQWEYVAKGGDPTAAGWVRYPYAGSDTVDDVAWYRGNSGSASHAVGTKAANGLGIYDMSGNVQEWCWDWSGSYSSDPQTDPTGPADETPGYGRVRRNGYWNQSAIDVITISRGNNTPDTRGNFLGFRLARPTN